jgi:predicted O-methyltransferase YrrM
MTIIDNLKNLALRGMRQFANATQDAQKGDRDVDIVLFAHLLGPDTLPRINFPVSYVEFLRHCMEPAAHRVVVVKSERGSTDVPIKKFEMLVDQLREGLPAIEYPVAREIGLIADRYRSLREPLEFPQRMADLGLHFSISSSFGVKGRILFNVIRLMRSECCLEIGTAYGMSALFILAALKSYAQSGFLATIEGYKPVFLLSSSLLKQKYGEMVSCHYGQSTDVLPQLLPSLGKIDFLFHDAAHSREAYISDFNEALRNLSPGATVLVDDIRWEDPRLAAGEANTYEGWKTIISHPRVRRAVEIDEMLGLLLLDSA